MTFLGLEIGTWSELVSGIITGLALTYTMVSSKKESKIKLKTYYTGDMGVDNNGEGWGMHIIVTNKSPKMTVELDQALLCVRAKKHLFKMDDDYPIAASDPKLFKSDEDAILVPGQTYRAFLNTDYLVFKVDSLLDQLNMNIDDCVFMSCAVDRSGKFFTAKANKRQLIGWYESLERQEESKNQKSN